MSSAPRHSPPWQQTKLAFFKSKHIVPCLPPVKDVLSSLPKKKVQLSTMVAICDDLDR